MARLMAMLMVTESLDKAILLHQGPINRTLILYKEVS